MRRLKYQEIKSEEWDFEALCLVDEEKRNSENFSILRDCKKAVDYLFRNVEDFKPTPADYVKWTSEVFSWYLEDLEEAFKKKE